MISSKTKILFAGTSIKNSYVKLGTNDYVNVGVGIEQWLEK